MKCKCGEQGELKVFNTFQYYYCNKCKAEIEKPEEKPFDPFDPNTGSVDDFYLDLARNNIKQACKNIEQQFKNDGPITITLPMGARPGQSYKIYRNNKLIYEAVLVKTGENTTKWEIVDLNN